MSSRPVGKHSRNFKKMMASRMSSRTTNKNKNDDINTELLISLVSSRPTLWDKSLDSHMDHKLRSDAWKEVCQALCPELERKSCKEKQAYARIIIKKWTNVRDAWRKSLVESKMRKVFKPYIYHDYLRFLEKNLYFVKPTVILEENRKLIKEEDHISIIDSDDTPDYNKGDRSCQAEKPINEEPQDSENIMQYRDRAQMEESPHVSFIRGLIPVLGKLSDDEVLEFQAGVVRLLLDIRKSNTPVISEVHYGYRPSNIDADEIVNNIQENFIGP